MFPFFAKETTSWEGHLSGAIAGTICSLAFMRYGPQRPDPFADEEETPDEEPGDEDSIEDGVEPGIESGAENEISVGKTDQPS